MLGPPKLRDLNRLIVVSLESVVPKGHFYRHLARVLDLSFVRDLAADCYAGSGRPSSDPMVFSKLQLVMFFEGLRSERKLMEIASLNLAHRWYLGYNLDEPLPDHSSLSKIRARLGLPVFRRLFEIIVEQCVQAGLVWGKELIFDATNLPRAIPYLPQSSASRPCPVPSAQTDSEHTSHSRSQSALSSAYSTSTCSSPA